jgi:hypothetical protein
MSKPLYVAPGRGIAARRLGDEMMVMSGRDSTLFTLNEVATAIWEAADGSTTLEDIVKRVVCREFEVDSDLALRDAETLAEELAGHGILQLSEDPLPSAHEPR